mmetsp:Transcript_36687/g.80420  ORF Transcript_36687/g.80420 Transcript_36687/m.80420 type:complete len:109 (-) Transcript_36687:8-334(-)
MSAPDESIWMATWRSVSRRHLDHPSKDDAAPAIEEQRHRRSSSPAPLCAEPLSGAAPRHPGHDDDDIGSPARGPLAWPSLKPVAALDALRVEQAVRATLPSREAPGQR